MKKSVIKRANREIKEHVKNWTTIKITRPIPPCEPKQNHQCMNNAMNELKAKRAFAIMEVISTDGEVIHYLCVDEKGLVYDATLGYQWCKTEYKLIKYIHPDDKTFMGNHLENAKRKIIDDACSKKTKAMIKLLGIAIWDIV